MDYKEIQNITSFFQVYATDIVLSDTKNSYRVGNKFIDIIIIKVYCCRGLVTVQVDSE